MAEARPLFFWRRLGATLLDFILCFAVSFVLSIPFVGNGDHFRFSEQGFRKHWCTARPVSHDLLTGVFPPTAALQTIVCETQVNGFPNGQVLLVRSREVNANGTTVTRTIKIPVSETGDIVTPFPIQDFFAVILLVGGGGWLVRKGYATPGKWALGLVVQTARPFLREGLKYILLLLSLGLSTLALLAGLEPIVSIAEVAFANLPLLFAIVLAFVLLMLWYFLHPVLFLRRGQMFWDIWTDSQVTRNPRNG